MLPAIKSRLSSSDTPSLRRGYNANTKRLSEKQKGKGQVRHKPRLPFRFSLA